MAEQVPLYDATYGRFGTAARHQVRLDTYGEDLGQNGWLTAAEWGELMSWLELPPDAEVLDVACGSGGLALDLARNARAKVTGVDANRDGVATARGMAKDMRLEERARFQQADADVRLPFADDTFDALYCIDSINHFRDRRRVLAEWWRVLRPGGRLLFTDPVIVTGPVSSKELAVRSSIGHFLFVPPGEDERLLEEAGFELLRHEDASRNVWEVAARWRASRERHRDELVEDEGHETFKGLQHFLATVERLHRDGRLSRQVFVARRPVRPIP